MFIKKKEKYKVVDGDPQNVIKELPSGVYQIEIVEAGWSKDIILEKTKKYENTKIIPAGIFKKIENYIDTFTLPEMYTARKEIHALNKLGLLFHGRAGTGKTFLAGQIGQKLAVEKNAVCIIMTDYWRFTLPDTVDMLRQEDPNRLIVIILDEFEKGLSRRGSNDPDLLTFLDGSASKDNCIVLALVNATEKLNDTLTKRMGRFEQVFNFDEINIEVLSAMIHGMIPDDYKNRIDVNYIAKKLTSINNTTVDAISIAIRDSIAEILYFEHHGVFHTIDSFTSAIQPILNQRHPDPVFVGGLVCEDDEDHERELEDALKACDPRNYYKSSD